MMRKFYIPFAMAIIAMTGLSQAASADDVIVRHRAKTGQEEVLKVDHKQLPELEKAIRESKSLDRFKAPMRDSAGGQEQPEGFAVRFAVEEEEGLGKYYEPWKVYVCKGNGEYGRDYYNYAYYQGEDYDWGCYVPEGEYTVILSSDIYSSNQGDKEFLGNSYLVMENVEISSDTTITFRQSDAKNRLSSKCYLPDGSEAPEETGIYNENGEFRGVRDDLSLSYSRSIVNVNCDYCLNSVSNMIVSDEVYVNDLSDNWIYAINMTVVDKDGAYVNCVTKRGPFTSDTCIENDPSDYVLTSVAFNSSLPGVNAEAKGFGVSTRVSWKGADWNMGAGGMAFGELGITEEIPIFVNSHKSDYTSEDSFDLIFSPCVATDEIKIVIGDNGENPESETMNELESRGYTYIYSYFPIYDETSGEPYFYYVYPTLLGSWIYKESNDNFVCIDGNGYSVPDYPDEIFFFPYDSTFSFIKDDNTKFFSYAPLTIVGCDSFIRGDGNYSRFVSWPAYSYPCLAYGALSSELSALYNGEKIVENIDFSEFDWYNWSSPDGEWNYKEYGVFDITYMAQWNDEDSEAITKCHAHIDTNNADYEAPYVSLWQLRDGEGNLTDKASFESKLLLICNDGSGDNFDFDISCVENPEYKFSVSCLENNMTEIQKFFEVDMEDFPGEVGKRYSLVFNLKDASGNTCEQTIGHAFEWAGPTGVNGVGADADIFIENGRLYAPAGSEVYSIDGRKADANRLSTGLYIVKSGTATVKVLAK